MSHVGQRSSGVLMQDCGKINSCSSVIKDSKKKTNMQYTATEGVKEGTRIDRRRHATYKTILDGKKISVDEEEESQVR